MKRAFLLFLWLVFYSSAEAQKIELRNDSLLINGNLIRPDMEEPELNAILISDAKYENRKKNGRKQSFFLYKGKGIQFSKYRDDSATIYLFIKLHRFWFDKAEINTAAIDPLKGDLYIGNNYMNDKRDSVQLKNLLDVQTEFTLIHDIMLPRNPMITGGKMTYRGTTIRFVFDTHLNKLTSVTIEYRPDF